MKNNQLIKLGYCTKPHGIKGAASLHLENLEDSALKNGMKVFLKPQNINSKISENGEYFEIKSISFGNKAICFLENVDDRNKIEAIIPFDIYISREQFPEANSDEFYISDLMGLSVIDNESRTKVGSILRYFDNGAQLVIAVKLDKSGEVVELPFVDNFFPELNIEEGFVTFINPEVV